MSGAPPRPRPNIAPRCISSRRARRTWSPPVVTYSALSGDGVAGLWSSIIDHRERMTASGELATRRREQQVKWMWAMLEERVLARLKSDPAIRAKLPRIEAAVAEGRMTPALAVDEIAAALGV